MPMIIKLMDTGLVANTLPGGRHGRAIRDGEAPALHADFVGVAVIFGKARPWLRKRRDGTGV